MTEKRRNASVERYLKRLSRELSHLGRADRDDIVREIEEHILERWESDSGGAFDEESLRGVFGKLGSAESIAAQYCEQRGWARPPKRHTARNAALTIVGIIILTFVIGTYATYKFIISPVVGAFKDSVVEVDDSGVRVLNGAVSVTDEGVKVRGIVDIKASDEGVEIGGHNKMYGIKKLLAMEPIAEKTGSLTIPASDFAKMKLTLKSGKLSMSGGPSDKIEVSFVKKVYGTDKAKAAKIVDEMDLKQKKDGKTIDIEAVNPLPQVGDYPDGIYGVTYEIAASVPKRLEADIDCKYCISDVSKLAGPLRMDVKYGSTKIDEIEKSLVIDDNYGSLEARKIGGDVDVNGKYGTLDVEDVAGKMNLDNSYGTSTIKGVGGDFNADSKYGQMDLSGVRGNMNISSKYGEIDIDLMDGYGFAFQADSKYGSIDCDFPTQKNGDQLTARVGDGNHKVMIDAKYGSVDVRR
jgi:hypothetical protein